MKLLIRLSCICLGALGLVGRLGAVVITFDDLPATPPPGGGTSIPSGYAGFAWNNFDYETVMNNLALNPSGYLNWMVSPGNVAFNGAGTPALFSGTAFNLMSAYLTGAWNDGLNLEVQGFVGALLVYDNHYTVNSTAPTLINFNYLGVDEVNFISSGGTAHGYAGGAGQQFVLDNLTVATPEPSSFVLAVLGILGLATTRFRRQPHGTIASSPLDI
jgi:hypothetical protein